jgi:hypothetical protein
MMTIRNLRVWSEYSITLAIVPLTPTLSLREREEVSFQPFLNKSIPGQNQDNLAHDVPLKSYSLLPGIRLLK